MNTLVPDDSFDVDRAIGRLGRRVRWLRWGALAAAVVCAGLWAGVIYNGMAWWSDPLHPVLTQIHIPMPAQTLNATMEAPSSVSERALAFIGVAIAIISVVAWRRVDGARRYLVVGCGIGLMALVLVAQKTQQAGDLVNQDLPKLARAGHYRELLLRVKARPQLPYGQYIAAQALVLSGSRAQLKDEYGEWLHRWAAEAVRAGYLGDKEATPGGLIWEGSHARPRVMRALERAAFGSKTTVYSPIYDAEARAAIARSRKGVLNLLPLALLATAMWVGCFVVWWSARRNKRLAEECVVKFDYYQPTPEPAPLAALPEALAPASLPPIDFHVDATASHKTP